MPKTLPPLRPAVMSSSPARESLAKALSDIRAAEEQARAASDPVIRLEAEIAAEDAVRAQLAERDALYAAQMAAWAETGHGPAPEQDAADRQAALDQLTAAGNKADAARRALVSVRQRAADADRHLAGTRDSIKPAVAGVLREEAARGIAEYWRLYAGLENLRRELAALDQLLISDFPIVHAATGRTIVDWISPEKLSAPAVKHAADTACADLASVQDFLRDWQAKAADLLGRQVA